MRRPFLCLGLFLLLLSISNTATGQHYDDWTGFHLEEGRLGRKDRPLYYELQKDYTVDMPSYFVDKAKMPPGSRTNYHVQKYRSWAQNLPVVDSDFVQIKKGGILTIKKGFRWDGASRPCKDLYNCIEKPYHFRSSAVHDALYDLMRMRLLDPDNHHLVWCEDTHLIWRDGDYNRKLADILLYMITKEDGQGTGAAGGDYRIVRDFGPCKTENEKFLNSWKFHASELTAQPADTGIELTWRAANAALEATTTDYVVNEYWLARLGGEPPLSIAVVKPSDPKPYPDLLVADDTEYRYRLTAKALPNGSDDDQPDGIFDYFSNLDVVVRATGSGNALSLDGNDDYVEADTVAFDLTPAKDDVTAYSMEAWVYPTRQQGDSAILGFTASPLEDLRNPWLLMYCGDTEQFCFKHSGGVSGSADTFPPGKWYHVAVTVDNIVQSAPNVNGTLYVNGTRQATFFSSEKSRAGQTFSVGEQVRLSPYSVAKHFEGEIDEARVWNMARSESEIQEGMCTTLRGNDPNLLGLWHFDTPTDKTVDSSQCDPIDIEHPVEMDYDQIRAYLANHDRSRCTAYDATSNANDGTLRGYSVEDTAFVASGAMTPTITTREIFVTLDAAGQAPISAAELIADSTFADCIGSMDVSPSSFNCQDLEKDNTATLTYTDKNKVTRTVDNAVTLTDEIPPEITDLSVTPQSLGSADNKMVSVLVNAATISDNCGALELNSCKIVNVTSSEPSLARKPDILLTSDLAVELRAQSYSSSLGRTYTLTVECEDGSGNATQSTVTVTVDPWKFGGGTFAVWFLAVLSFIALRRHRIEN